MVADQIGAHLASAFERHISELHSLALLQQDGDDLILLFGSGAAHLHARLLLHGRQVFFGALVRCFFVHPQDETVKRHPGNRREIAPAEWRPRGQRCREQVRQGNDNRVRVALLFLHVQKTLGAGAAGLVDHDERSRRELVLIADAGHQTRHLIGAAAGAGRYHKLNGLGGLPSDCYGLSKKELNDKSRGDHSTQATDNFHITPFSGSALASTKTQAVL